MVLTLKRVVVIVVLVDASVSNRTEMRIFASSTIRGGVLDSEMYNRLVHARSVLSVLFPFVSAHSCLRLSGCCSVTHSHDSRSRRGSSAEKSTAVHVIHMR